MKIKFILIALALVLLLSGGCSSVDKTYTARTTAGYTSNGTSLSYDSSKNQENFKADVELTPDGKVTKLHVETTASTPEAAIAAALQSNLKAMDALTEVLKRIPIK